MSTLIPFLWFDTQAEEAARHYAAIFPGARLGEITRFPENSRHGAPGSVMTAAFTLADGQRIVAFNGNRRHAFSPASSLLVRCASAEEAGGVAEQLAAGGERQPGGWLVDKFGVSWQIAAGNVAA